MSISSKLATDFVKRNFNFLEFENRPKNVSAITHDDLFDAYVRVGCNEIKLFNYETCSIGTTTVLLPERLCGKLGLEEALRRIDKENMNMDSCYNHGKTVFVRVTTNRLIMLEKLMKNSGLINDRHEAFKFDTAKAMIEDESGNTVEALNQANLSDIDGVIIDGVKYYPALEVEKLCYKADKLYTSLKREYDKAKKEYEKTCRSIDPTFVEAQSKMLQLAKDLSITSLQTVNTIIDKLTENVQKLSKN